MWWDTVGTYPLEEEYNKDTGISKEDIKKLRAWLKTQPHLPEEHISDLDLICAYHCCNRSSEVTKQVLDINLTLRTLFLNLFKERHVDNLIIRSLQLCVLAPLECRSKNDEAIFYGRLLDTDAKNFIFANEMKAALMMIDLWQFKTGTWPGIILLFDLECLTLGHLARLDLQTLQQFFYYLQEAMLVKVHGLHFLNAPSFIDKLLMLIKPFLKKTLMESLHIHQVGSKTLEKFVPISGLPKEAGGEGKTFKQYTDALVKWFNDNKDYFENENKRRVVESKRPGKPKTISDIFGGVEGSFKKLDID